MTASVHVAVCEAFHGSRPEGHEVAHDNGDPGDNRSENLAWKTRSQNAMDRVRHGTDNRGERNHWTKVSDQDVREIRKSTETHAALARAYGISSVHVYKIRARLARTYVEDQERAK